MKHLPVYFAPLFLPSIAFAQAGTTVTGPIGNTLGQVYAIILSLIPIILAVAVLLFFWGIIKFIASAGDEEARKAGISFMLWGMVGLFVMVTFWGLIGYVQEAFGLSGTPPVSVPAPVIENPVPEISG